MPVDTASGAIATFNTEIEAPLQSVIADIVATGGNGTPSNPIPINGYTEAIITANGTTHVISFGQTVYGGVLDVTRGILRVTLGLLSDMSSLNWAKTTSNHVFYAGLAGKKVGFSAEMVCEQYTVYEGYFAGMSNNQIASNSAYDFVYVRNDNCDTVEDIKTSLANCKLVYELATPVTYQLSPTQVRAIVGSNNVWSDTGNIEVKYKTTIQDYIDSHTGG